MISRDFAQTEVMRLSGLNYFPRITEALNELVLAASTAQDEFHCHDAITEFAQGEQECPKPADLLRVLQQTKKITPRRSCTACGGTGFVMVRKQYAGDREDLKRMYAGRAIDYSEPCKACV